MHNTELVSEMGRSFYGYGHWDAPYWFVGPEQGQGKGENDDLMPRARAWERLGKPDLSDLKQFHDLLEPGMWTREETPLQKTWRRLMLILLTFKGEPTDRCTLREYQRVHLGRYGGETCLPELSGYPAHSSNTLRNRDDFRQERLTQLAGKIQTYRPTFVVMYGKGAQNHWEELAGRSLVLNEAVRSGSTAILFTKHPVAYGGTDNDLCSLGDALSRATGGSVL